MTPVSPTGRATGARAQGVGSTWLSTRASTVCGSAFLVAVLADFLLLLYVLTLLPGVQPERRRLV
ncbi:hypothetical protein AB0B09_16995, partial [Streptomyces sp. NPDC044948]